MKIQWTRVTDSDPIAIEMLIADAPTPEVAGGFLHLRMTSDKVMPEWHLPAIQREVLERARELLNDEIQNARERLSRAPH
jgi:hypothetical protein